MNDFFFVRSKKEMYLKFTSWVTAKKKKERNNNHFSKLKNLYIVRKIAFVQQGLPLFPVFFSLPLHFVSSQGFQLLTS